MNETVWYEHIDRGLKDYIGKNILLVSSSGVPFNVPVRIRKPDEDFKIEDYPMITISHLGISRRDEIRYSPHGAKLTKDIQRGVATIDPPAVPYTLKYQIDLWATLQRDMNAMTQQWLYKFGRDFNLPVIDSGGIERTALCVWSGDAVNLEDRLSSGDRMFHTPMTYSIWAELDTPLTSTLDEVYLVKEIEVNDSDFPKNS